MTSDDQSNKSSSSATKSQSSKSQTSVPSSSSQPALSSTRNAIELTPGALAGAILGAALFVAIVAVALTYLFMKNRNQKMRKRLRKGYSLGTGKRNTERRDSRASEKYRWESHLPSPADDQTVSTKVQTLQDQIEDHVDTFYKNEAGARPSAEIEEAIKQLGDQCLKEAAHPLRSVIWQTQSPTVLIRRCLADLCLSSHHDHLPTTIGPLLQAIVENRDRSEDIPGETLPEYSTTFHG
ncbi:hypothetical protein B0J12DRAFT_733881 [Macrophomina phaseolina]|uniref:Transmembrane protein n=1 Tax=Macrophomina phaseolina TaxID=35725 RepID=A0ABQ8FPK6_9PEZI|nr:hypothetical protein B0J12DRAFT_733881 [Macrophomina phaseolina]